MPDLVKQLTKVVGKKNILSSRRDLLAYSYDATQRQEMPEVVVFADTTSQISEIMKIAFREKVSVVPRGAGTGISGGTVPVNGGIIIELSRMNRIIALDTANRRAVVEPGLVNLDLQNALAPLGFMYPPDPASQKSCTLGGNIGENAGGPLCFQYGVTSKYVCGIEAVLSSGEIVELGSSVEDSPGYDLRGLLIGSEGTLAIATKLILSILPLPEASKTLLAVFNTLPVAGQAVADIIGAGIIPASLELMDRKMCWAIEESIHAGYPVDADGVLLIEVSGLAESLDRQANDITEICRKNQAREVRSAKTSGERDALWKGRKGAFGSVARLCPPYLVNDGTVPRNKLVQALLKVQELSAKHKVEIANVAHAGDGNLHPLILFDSSNREQVEAARKTGEEIMDTCIELGGTISGEHGIGLEKLLAMRRMFSAADLAMMQRVKQVFDPANILNPGKLFPPGTDIPGKAVNNEAMNADPPVIRQKLVEIVGETKVTSTTEVDTDLYKKGIKPELVASPATTAEVAEIIKAGNIYRKAIIPRGLGSKQNSGPPVAAADIILDMRSMTQITDLDTGNFTARVEAGILNSELQKNLSGHGLFFPFEPIDSKDSTIGGDLAANADGLWRFRYGTLRDLVLGMTVVTPTGEIVHPGGKTIKNVAGLDLVKMFIGSWGTLGIITEAVLRLYLMPEVRRELCFVFPGSEPAFRLVDRILSTSLWPAAIELIDRSAGIDAADVFLPALKDDEVMLLIDISGSQEVATRHLKEINAFAEANKAIDKVILEADRTIQTWQAYRQMRESWNGKTSPIFTGKASVPLAKTAHMYRAIKEIGSKNHVEAGIVARCGSGILSSFFPCIDEIALNIISDLQLAATSLGGLFILEKAPLWLKKNYGLWHRYSAHQLMAGLKQSIDPSNILNPGKMTGGQY